MCLNCGKEFSKRKGQKFCSHPCSAILSVGNKHALGYRHTKESIAKIQARSHKENHWNWKGGMPNCVICNVKLSFKKGTHCRKHRFEQFRKEGHPRWIADRKLLSRYLQPKERMNTLYVRWRNEIKRRDNSACRIKNEDCNGRLEIHHILNWREYPELRYDINNGIALCRAHHPLGRAEEKRLAPTFQEIVSVLNVQD